MPLCIIDVRQGGQFARLADAHLHLFSFHRQLCIPPKKVAVYAECARLIPIETGQ